MPLSTPIELKFNPYHDPRNGQFIFAPGGPRSLDRVIVSKRGERARLVRTREHEAMRGARDGVASWPTEQSAEPAVYRPAEIEARLEPASSGNRRPPRGSNSAAFRDPMTLEQVFPGLRNAPAGSMLVLADNALGLTQPMRELTAELTKNHTSALINQIRAVDPAYRFESLGFPQTMQGQVNQINNLQFERAAAMFRVRGELRPLQVETLKNLQRLTDEVYERGLELLNEGKLPIHISARLSLGNYVDREVRKRIRVRYSQFGIAAAGAGPVRVNRRENDASGSDTTFRRPDARVGQIAYDVTFERKTLKTDQIVGFFRTEFRPTQIVIVRPSQLGPASSYVIIRPETRR